MKVLYQAACYQSGTRVPVLDLLRLQDFDLALLTKDLRSPGTYEFMGLTRTLMRGVFAAYCSVVFDKTLARVRAVESQALLFLGPETGILNLRYFQLGVTTKRTGDIHYDNRTTASQSLTASNIVIALNTMFGTTMVSVSVINDPWEYGFLGYAVRFIGAYDRDMILLRTDNPNISIKEAVKGDPSNLASFLPAFSFSSDYPNGHQAFNSPTGIDRLGAFGNITGGGGTTVHEVVRVRMLALQAGTLTFTPTLAGLLYPNDDTSVYGNFAATPPEFSGVLDSEIQLIPCALPIR